MKRKILKLRIPKRIPTRPLDYRDCAPVGNPWSRRETFIILHVFGYVWHPRLKRWSIPKNPSPRVEVRVVHPVYQ